MSLKSVLETIGKDIEKGLQVAAPVIGAFDPPLGIILSEIGQLVAAVESVQQATTPPTAPPTPLTPEQVSAIVSAVTTITAIKAHPAAKLLTVPSPSS